MPDWDRVKSLFEEVIELPEDLQLITLRERCGRDEELHSAVESLLSSHRRAGPFLDTPTLITDVDSNALQAEGLGGGDSRRRIGPYTLLELLGEGGFGTVYRARQDEPVRRQVAMKIIKPGMDSREVIARFESERQALAMMSHPNIAGVLDAGTTDAGRPYFVMEYVLGEPITAYCDNHRLCVQERLGLFTQICRAVQHAHQKGVIHRDIKPSNVLVMDASPGDKPISHGPSGQTAFSSGIAGAIVKVIDFGVAKATEQHLSDKSLLTQQGMLIGTPEYMSPEQAASSLDIDTRTDVYSLGVLLYELLTGSVPLDRRSLCGKGFGEIQRIIRELEPTKPSARLTALARNLSRNSRARPPEAEKSNSPAATSPAASVHHTYRRSGEEISRLRRTDLKKLVKDVRGDLDWIVMKCIEKDRTRRYGTANEVALEIGRVLGNEPVLAGPPTLGYRLRKFARRNRAAFVAIAGIALAISIGLGLSIAGLVAAVRARMSADEQRGLAQQNAERAVRASRKADAVNRFVQDMLASADPSNSARRDITVREALDRAVQQLDAGAMQGQSEIAATIRLTIGKTYIGLARYEAAGRQIELAASFFESRAAEGGLDYANALQQRGVVRKLSGRIAEAEPDFRAALAILRSLSAESAAIAACLNDLGTNLTDLKRYGEAESVLLEAERLARLPENVNEPVLAEALNNLGLLHVFQKQWEAAEPLIREAILVNRRIVGHLHPSVATNLDNLAQVLQARGEMDAAESAYREALDTRRELFGSAHPDVAFSLHNLAFLLYERKNLSEAESALKEARAIFCRTRGLAHPDTLTVTDSLVSVLGVQGRFEEVERLLLETFEAIREADSIPAARKLDEARRLAQLYVAWKKPDQAAAWEETASTLAKLADTSRLSTAGSDVSTPVPASSSVRSRPE